MNDIPLIGRILTSVLVIIALSLVYDMPTYNTGKIITRLFQTTIIGLLVWFLLIIWGVLPA